MFDPKIAEYNQIYYQHFRNAILNCIHRKISGNWKLNFGIVLLYFTSLFIYSLHAPDEAQSEDFLLPVLFNFHVNQRAVVLQNYSQILIVLMVTVFENYFVQILKHEDDIEDIEY